MNTLEEGKLQFDFPDDWTVSAYDKWSYYQKHFKDAFAGNKGVDFVARDTSDNVWLIEVKDFRENRRTKEIPLWDEIAIKVRDTLAGLVGTSFYEGNPNQQEAWNALESEKIRVVLHLEQPETNSKLFPRAFDPQMVRQKLKHKNCVRPIDPHPIVVESSSMNAVGWDAKSKTKN